MQYGELGLRRALLTGRDIQTVTTFSSLLNMVCSCNAVGRTSTRECGDGLHSMAYMKWPTLHVLPRFANECLCC